ncbi:MAG: S-formylglutathione hydrolase [Pseudomonadota bacterium]
MNLSIASEIRCFGGRQIKFTHASDACSCEMTASLYLPPQADSGVVPLLIWLSGLTCTDENFTTKAGAQRYAAEHGIAVLAPDTSPRGDGVPDDPEGAYDFGLGAGFYVNATQDPWAAHYRMDDYITKELPSLVMGAFPLQRDAVSISGHSMGGHGALVLALRSPGAYRSVSAFAPIASPTRCPWGEKALGGYLGEDRSAWEAYDATHLIAEAKDRWPLLVDIGTADPFLTEQLNPELLEEACAKADHLLTLRRQDGYDHSYYFIASFIGDHIAHHAAALRA